MYIIKTMGGDTLKITEEEYKGIINTQPKGLVFIKSLGGSVNLSSVETILSEEHHKRARKENQTEGYLHDGLRVVKKFGKWCDPQNPDINFDTSYYPEITKDKIATAEEFDKFKKDYSEIDNPVKPFKDYYHRNLLGLNWQKKLTD